MTASITHVFQSQLPDGTTPGMLEPSHWNAAHQVSIAPADIGAQPHSTALDNVSGVNTGDQDLSGLATLTSPTFTGTVTGNFYGNLAGNSSTVTTNANLTGPVTSVGNATAIANSTITNAMLANSAVANLTGTNTGDETQATILSKVATSTDGAVLSIEQGPSTDTGTTTKLQVLSKTGTAQFTVSPSTTGIGMGSATTLPDRPLVVSSDFNPLAAGNASILVQGSANKERFELRSYNVTPGPIFNGCAATGTQASPTPVNNGSTLFGLYGFGWNGTAFGGSTPGSNSGAAAFLIAATETHSTSAKGANIQFQTTANGATARTTRVKIDQSGFVGIGVTAPTPTQQLEVAGNIYLDTAGNKLMIATGSNASVGTGALTAGTVTIATTAVTANSLVFITGTGGGANLGRLDVTAKSAGVSFTVTSANVLDTSSFSWFIIN